MNIIPLKIWLIFRSIVNANGAVTVTDPSFNSNEILVYKVDYLIVLWCLLMWCSTKCFFQAQFLCTVVFNQFVLCMPTLCASWLGRKIPKACRNTSWTLWHDILERNLLARDYINSSSIFECFKLVSPCLLTLQSSFPSPKVLFLLSFGWCRLLWANLGTYSLFISIFFFNGVCHEF